MPVLDPKAPRIKGSKNAFLIAARAEAEAMKKDPEAQKHLREKREAEKKMDKKR